MRAPIVSVIIPVYNRESFVEKCLVSLLSQTLDRWEAICVDDGSTDNSSRILDSFSSRDNRIKVIHQKNAGVACARNVALQFCTAPYISMMDSDDYLEPDALRQMVYAIEESAADLVIVAYRSQGKDGQKLFVRPPFLSEGLHSVNITQFLSLSPAPWAKLYKRNIIQKYKLSFPENISMGEDAVFVASYWSHVVSCYALSSILYNTGDACNSLTFNFRRGCAPYTVYLDTLSLSYIIYENTIDYVDEKRKNKWISVLLEYFLIERDFVFDYVVCSVEELNRLRYLSKERYHFLAGKLDWYTKIKVILCYKIMRLKGILFRCLGAIKRWVKKYFD